MLQKWVLGALAMAMLVSPVFGACPNKCSGHGRCGRNDVCDCMQNWTNGDCSGRVCPFARAWHDTATGTDDAHYYAECSNRGTCDREKGLCECDAGFTGSGCRRMVCPDDCSGHGTCEFIEELAGDGADRRVGGVFGRQYTLWDQEKIMGCRCDAGYQGHNCASRVCPKGDDPLTTGQSEMVQAIVVDTASVEGYLTYYDPYGNAWSTGGILFGAFASQAASCALVQTALRRLPNNVLNLVEATGATDFYGFARTAPNLDTGVVAAQTTGGNTAKTICLITFKSEPGTTGYQQLLGCNVAPHAVIGMQPNTVGNAAATCEVTEVFPGASGPGANSRPLSELAECSNRGACDYSVGMCKCYSGHMGSACQKQEALV